VLKLISKLFGKNAEEKAAPADVPTQAAQVQTPPQPEASQDDPDELAAVIAAALSAYMGDAKSASAMPAFPYRTSAAWAAAARHENTLPL